MNGTIGWAASPSRVALAIGPFFHRLADVQRRFCDLGAGIQQRHRFRVKPFIGAAQLIGIAGQGPAFLGPAFLGCGREDEYLLPQCQREGNDLYSPASVPTTW